MNRSLKKVLLVFLLLTFLGGGYLWVRRVALTSTFLTKIVGVEVSLDSLDLTASSLEVKNLKIKNPSGYKNKEALQVSMVRVVASPIKLIGKERVINAIEIGDALIHMEIGGKKGYMSNWSEILSLIDGEEERSRRDQVVKADEKQEGNSLLVERFSLKKGVFKVRHPLLGKTTAKVADVLKENIEVNGEKNSKQVIKIIFNTLMGLFNKLPSLGESMKIPGKILEGIFFPGKEVQNPEAVEGSKEERKLQSIDAFEKQFNIPSE